jgi:hypothetical protein
MTYLRSRLVPLILVAALPASGIVFVRTAEAEAPSAGASTAFEAGSDSRARRLIRELRQELAPVEDQIRNHPYLAALENGEVSLDNLRAFAGEQYNIIASDLRSDALLVSRFGATPTGEFFRGIFEGEVLALCPCSWTSPPPWASTKRTSRPMSPGLGRRSSRRR